MIYTGIGARETPKEVQELMRVIARFMAQWGHTLRSGGASGADTAFENGCDEKEGKKEIYLPFEYFEQNNSPLFGSSREARAIARMFHPKWEVLGDKGRDFMGRNTYQILGLDLKTPTDLVIAWTSNGKAMGGTGQALRLAEHYQIPVLNMKGKTPDQINDELMELLIP